MEQWPNVHGTGDETMKISLPEKRAYYPASKNEPDYLLCWIPATELAQLAAEGRLAQDIADDYPGGLEIEVTASAFEDVELDLGASPETIRQAYAQLFERKRRGEPHALPESGRVDGAWLEDVAKTAEGPLASFAVGPADLVFSIGVPPPEPKMSDGQDALTVMQNL
jgi:hypothetical protein